MIQGDFGLPPIRKSMMKSQLSQPKDKKIARAGQYISESLKKVQEGCYRKGKLCIDEGFGDYRMSLFRLKDRKKRFHSNQTTFTPNFIAEIQKMTPELKQEFQNIIKTSNQHYLQKKQQQVDPQSHNQKLMEWKNQQEQYLYYQYVSNYERTKWFRQTIAQPIKEMPKAQQKTIQIKLKNKKKIRKTEQTHFFKFLENSSMIFASSS